MSRQVARVLLTVVLGVAASGTVAAPITTGLVTVFRDNEGPNTVGSGVGDNVTVVVRNVAPNLTTFGIAENPQVGGALPLINLFTNSSGFFNRTLALDSSGGGVVTQPWLVTLQNRGNLLQAQTNSLVGVGQLPLLSGLTVTGDKLAPTISWNPVVTAVPYSQVRLSIYNDRSDQIIVTERLIGGVGTTNYTVPVGTLAPNTDYSFRVFLWDPSGPGGTPLNRSSTHVQTTTTSASVSSGSLSLATAGAVNNAFSLAAGANNHSNSAVGIGVAGQPGAATLQSGTTLSATFLNAGINNIGSLVVDNTVLTLNGGTVNDGASITTQGGFMTAGRGSLGYIDVINGGQIQINSNGQLTPGFNVGRNSGSFGTISVDGIGSSIVITGPGAVSATASDNGLINVGRSGDGRLNIVGGGMVANAAAGETNIGRDPGSRGSVLVSGAGSLFDAGGQLNIGGIGGGEGALFIRDGGLVRAGSAVLGPGGFLSGNGGTLNLDNGSGALTVAGGVVAPGDSPGTLTIVGDLLLNDGTLLLEALDPGQVDALNVQGKIVVGAGASIEIMLGFDPLSPLSFLSATEGIELDAGFDGLRVFGLLGSAAPVGSLVQVMIGARSFDVRVQAAVPEPATFFLASLALAAMIAIRRTRWRVVRGGVLVRFCA